MIAEDVLRGGFADPVFQAQAVFRRVLDAFARPGRIVEIPAVVSAPAPLHQAAAAFICTFADEGTPVYFGRAMAQGSASAWIGFHTGAPTAASPDVAHFALITRADELPPFEKFAQGSQEYPDRSATIILQVDDLAGKPTLRLEGPGIDGAIDIGPKPLPENFVELMHRNRALFPRGVDLVLASSLAILTLPRSTRVSALREN